MAKATIPRRLRALECDPVIASLSLARVLSLASQESWIYSALGSHAASGGIGATYVGGAKVVAL